MRRRVSTIQSEGKDLSTIFFYWIVLLNAIFKIRTNEYTETQFCSFWLILNQPYLSDLSWSHTQIDTSLNSSLSQTSQKVTAMSVSSPDNCLPAERRWRRRNPLRHFTVSLKQVSMCPTAGSTDVTMRLLHKLILRPSAQFSCCPLLITKLSVTIYISAVYKPTIVSIEVITQPM